MRTSLIQFVGASLAKSFSFTFLQLNRKFHQALPEPGPKAGTGPCHRRGLLAWTTPTKLREAQR